MIVCWSVKGGSGTTVVAAALALVLAQRHEAGARLIDMSGDTPSALGMSEPSSEGIAEWLNATDHPGAEALNNLMLPVTAHLGVIPRGRSIIVPSLANPDRLRDLAEVIAQSHLPTIVDAGSGASMIPIIEHATRSLLIIRPCYLALRRASLLTTKPHGVIVITEPGRALGVHDVESVVGAPVLAEIPFDPAIARAVDAGLLAGRVPTLLAKHLADVFPAAVV
jgi:MinD-like ATPase involved in chromosome partitioning or flagellar assembly